MNLIKKIDYDCLYYFDLNLILSSHYSKNRRRSLRNGKFISDSLRNKINIRLKWSSNASNNLFTKMYK